MILIIHMQHHILRKKRYEIMKDDVFSSSPICLPFIPSKPSLSRSRDDHLIPLLSHDDSIFKAQLFLLICTLLTIHSAYMTKIKTFFYIFSSKNNGSISILASQWRQFFSFSTIQLSSPVYLRFRYRRN